MNIQVYIYIYIEALYISRPSPATQSAQLAHNLSFCIDILWPDYQCTLRQHRRASIGSDND